MPSKVLPAGSDKIRTIVNRDQFPLPPASVSRKTPATSLPPIQQLAIPYPIMQITAFDLTSISILSSRKLTAAATVPHDTLYGGR
jgi:hypothetical protein